MPCGFEVTTEYKEAGSQLTFWPWPRYNILAMVQYWHGERNQDMADWATTRYIHSF